MKLELNSEDLKPERSHISCARTAFHDFTEDIQAIIKIVGKATYYANKGLPSETSNIIRPPE
jgi:hypothetical protein